MTDEIVIEHHIHLDGREIAGKAEAIQQRQAVKDLFADIRASLPPSPRRWKREIGRLTVSVTWRRKKSA